MSEATSHLSSALADRYKIERHLGEGGMATVYLAEDLKHKRKVAVKVLRPELAAVLGAERFVQEITTTANLQHPHILPLFDSGEADGFLYYVMPYIEGETLRDKLNRETQLGIEEAVNITTAIADALDSAHQQGVIHRDIKPENILLHQGRPMVADFGIALAVSAAAGGRMTETGMSLGTPHYMSPEQATAEKDITHRSDIYSLGSVLYEMLTGEPPHMGTSAQAIIMKIVTEPADPVTKLRKSVPPNVTDAVTKSLEKLAADRFESAAKFADALTNPAFTLPATAVAVGAADSLWRRRFQAAGALAALFALMTVLAVLFPRDAGTGRGGVHRVTMVVPANQALAHAPIAVSPDGRLLAWTAQAPAALYVKSRDELVASAPAGAAEGYFPVFAPDGSAIAFVVGLPGSLHVQPLAGGVPRVILRDSVWSLGAWSRTGWIYVTAGTRSGALMRIRSDGSEVEHLVVPDSARGERSFSNPQSLPGENAVLLVVERAGGVADVVVIDLRNQERHVLERGRFAKYLPTGDLLVVRADGQAVAAPLDLERLALVGPVTEVLDGIAIGEGGGAMLAVADDGTLYYMPEEETVGQVVRVRRDGAVQVVDPAWSDVLQQVSLSPDGRKLAVVVMRDGRGEIWVKQLDTGPLTPVAAADFIAYRPGWSPDGRTITYIGDPDVVNTLLEVRADGTGTPRTLFAFPRGVDEGSWSPDGRWLIMRVGVGVSRDIYALQPGVDSVARPIVATEAQELAPALSPDGRWLVYASIESGQIGVYVQPFPDGGTRTAVSVGGAMEPAWSHDGRELYFRSDTHLMAVDVETDGEFRASEPRELFSTAGYWTDGLHTSYAVSPDDQSFYFVRRASGAGTHLVMVLNWFEELEAKMGGNR